MGRASNIICYLGHKRKFVKEATIGMATKIGTNWSCVGNAKENICWRIKKGDFPFETRKLDIAFALDHNNALNRNAL